MPGLLELQLDKILFRRLTDGTRQYAAFSKAQSDARIKEGTSYKTRDILASLLEFKDPETGEAFTLPELVSENSLLIVAGKLENTNSWRRVTQILTPNLCSDTLETAITSSFLYLLHYRESLTKLDQMLIKFAWVPSSRPVIICVPSLTNQCACLQE